MTNKLNGKNLSFRSILTKLNYINDHFVQLALTNSIQVRCDHSSLKLRFYDNEDVLLIFLFAQAVLLNLTL